MVVAVGQKREEHFRAVEGRDGDEIENGEQDIDENHDMKKERQGAEAGNAEKGEKSERDAKNDGDSQI